MTVSGCEAAGIALLNGKAADGSTISVTIRAGRIVSVGEMPAAGDRVVDLQGHRVLPGLINAHDHLQLNSLLPCQAHGGHQNAAQWSAEVAERRVKDLEFARRIAMPRAQRLMLGGLKNLLSGVTTVAHHDPLYDELTRDDFPVDVVRDFGWSHSIYLDGVDKVRDSFRSTASDRPWIIHAAEGVDEDSRGEFDRLAAIGCLQSNTLLVHGIALDASRRGRLLAAGGGLVWCPSSNLNLFGRTAHVADLLPGGRVALGTDSRLSGGRDLLDELRIAAATEQMTEALLESMVTCNSARLLKLADRGELRPGARADVTVLSAGSKLGIAARADVRLVVCGGRALFADTCIASQIAPKAAWSPLQVDGRPRALSRPIALALLRSGVQEDGVEFPQPGWRAA